MISYSRTEIMLFVPDLEGGTAYLLRCALLSLSFSSSLGQLSLFSTGLGLALNPESCRSRISCASRTHDRILLVINWRLGLSCTCATVVLAAGASKAGALLLSATSCDIWSCSVRISFIISTMRRARAVSRSPSNWGSDICLFEKTTKLTMMTT